LPQISPLTPPPQCPHPPEPALARPAQLCPENLPSEAKVDGRSRLSERRSLPAHQGQGQGGAFDSPKSTSSTTTRLERKDNNNNKQSGHAETGRMVRPHGETKLAELVRREDPPDDARQTHDLQPGQNGRKPAQGIKNQFAQGIKKTRIKRKPAQGIKHPRPPPLSCHAAHAGAGTRARTSWSINLRTHTAAAPGQTAWYGQTGRQEKNRSSKTRRGAATKTAEISAILTGEK